MESRNELAKLITQFATKDGVWATAVPRLHLFRSSRTTEPLHSLHEPAFCLIVQGRKKALLGDTVFEYDADKFLVVSVDSPVVGYVTEASPETPYLSVRLDLDPAMIGQIMLDANLGSAPETKAFSALHLSEVTPDLVDAVIRLVKLLGQPGDIGVLAPLAEREILYRLLTGEQGHCLRQIAVAESRIQQVNRAIGWIKKNFREPFSIEHIAKEARMSTSALHSHFKAVTALSPLQYQKQLRLQEARRLILSAAMDAATAGHNVGYESPSQFSREYARTFGAPPMRDIARMKAAPELFTGVV